MAKFLRYLAVHPEPSVLAVLRENTNHLSWMFEYYLAPYPTGNVSKVNVYLTADAASVTAPWECLGIVEVREHFDIERYPSLASREQQLYYLDRLHTGLLRCAREYGWEESGISAARERMLADDLRFAILWKKPLASPDRRTKVQGFVEPGPRTDVGLIFFDGKGNEVRRSLITNVSTGSIDLRYFFGKIAWIDNQTVRVTQDNGRDYWLCTVDGRVEFHYPRAEGGDAQGEFALGRMYYDGRVVLQNKEEGERLIRSAASKGDKHAKAFLDRLERKALNANG